MRKITKIVAAMILFVSIMPSVYAAPINVFAAASLTEAFTEIGNAYQRLNPADNVQFSFAGSPTLRTQIQQGAPADVFASADRPNIDALVASQVVSKTQIFAKNTLVVVTPAKSARVERLIDLSAPGVKVVLAGSNVPVGHYAEQVLTKMTPSIAPNFDTLVLANVVSRDRDVKAVLAKVQLGEADAGIVYATDARAAGNQVRTIAIPEQFNVVAEYPVATVTAAPNPAGAAKFVAFLLGASGQAILKAHGFLSVGGATK